jgi:hypothetical protein
MKHKVNFAIFLPEYGTPRMLLPSGGAKRAVLVG